jgi:hypothetical protein
MEDLIYLCHDTGRISPYSLYVLFFSYPSKSHTEADVVVSFSLQPGQPTF